MKIKIKIKTKTKSEVGFALYCWFDTSTAAGHETCGSELVLGRIRTKAAGQQHQG
jgi:hypothetical protein